MTIEEKWWLFYIPHVTMSYVQNVLFLPQLNKIVNAFRFERNLKVFYSKQKETKT